VFNDHECVTTKKTRLQEEARHGKVYFLKPISGVLERFDLKTIAESTDRQQLPTSATGLTTRLLFMKNSD
jgi:hypothetical protein